MSEWEGDGTPRLRPSRTPRAPAEAPSAWRRDGSVPLPPRPEGQNDGDRDDVADDDEEEPLLASLPHNNSFVTDLIDVLKGSWLPALLVGACCGLFVAYVLIRDAENGGDHGFVDGEFPLGWREADRHARRLLATTRRIPTPEEQMQMAAEWLNAETTIRLPEGGEVGFMALAPTGEAGHWALPDLFFDSVMFGITASNPGALHATFTEEENRAANERMLADLEGLEKPRVSQVLRAVSRNKQTGWAEEGFAVQFRFEDLRRQGYQGEADRNGTLWQPAKDAVLKLARRHNQLAVYQWFPYRWGALPAEGGEEGNGRLHHNVLQEVVPARTGLAKLRSYAVIWRTK